jgi:GT2 family glycosyltransferase
MNIVVCSATKKKNPEDTAIWKSLQKIGDIDIDIECENTKGLGKYYNNCIKKHSDSDSIVFVHDDVDIINSDLSYQLLEGFKKYDVIGVAGCVSPKIIEKNLWHWMAGDRNNCRGIAGHPVDEKSFFVTSFGATPSRVTVIDGVFMALNTKRILSTGTFFDEEFNFHHYDIDFSLTCNANGIKIGVCPILINHQSPGLKEFDSTWDASNLKFINKWKNK